MRSLYTQGSTAKTPILFTRRSITFFFATASRLEENSLRRGNNSKQPDPTPIYLNSKQKEIISKSIEQNLGMGTIAKLMQWIEPAIDWGITILPIPNPIKDALRNGLKVFRWLFG